MTAQPYTPGPDRRCGTCRWLADVDADRIGSCAAPLPPGLPAFVDDLPEARIMHASGGRRCPAWEPRP